MIDVVIKCGIKIDYYKLMKKLKIFIFLVVVCIGKGIKYLFGEIKYLGEGY